MSDNEKAVPVEKVVLTAEAVTDIMSSVFSECSEFVCVDTALIPQGVTWLDPMMRLGPQVCRGRRDAETRRRCREALAVNIADKVCATLEVVHLYQTRRIQRWLPLPSWC